MTQILNSVNSMANIEEGRIQMELKYLDLFKLIGEVLGEIRDYARERQIVIKFEYEHKSLPSTIVGDTIMIGDTLMCIISNAIKFSPPNSTVIIRVTPFEGASINQSQNQSSSPQIQQQPQSSSQLPQPLVVPSTPKQQQIQQIQQQQQQQTISNDKASSMPVEVSYVKISVIDTGPGIKAHDQQLIFKEFHHIRASELSGDRGAGLSLSRCKKFIEMHKGTIGINSVPGRGSEFYILLPLPEEQSVVDPSTCTIVDEVIQTTQPIDFHNVTILLVEDLASTRKLMGFLFKRQGIEQYSFAENGKEAVDLIKSGHEYDIIFMDKEMPVMDGYESTREMRKMGYQRPIIGLTANALEEDKRTFVKRIVIYIYYIYYIDGVNEVVTKPLNTDEFKRVLTTYATGNTTEKWETVVAMSTKPKSRTLPTS